MPRVQAVLLGIVVYMASSAIYGRDLTPEQPAIESDELRTAAVSWLDGGARKEAHRQWCHQTDPKTPFAQRTLKVAVAHQHDADEARCELSVSQFTQIAPGIEEPAQVCVSMYVRSVGGVANNNKRGHLRCRLSAQRYAAPDEPVAIGLDGPLGPGDSIAVVPSLPADLTLRRSDRSSILLATPLRGLQAGLDKAVKELKPPKDGMTLKVLAARLEAGGPHATMLGLYLKLDVQYQGLGASCEIKPAFAIPAAPPDQIALQELQTQASCSTGNDLLKLLNVPQLLSNQVRSQIAQAFEDMRKNSETGKQFNEWATEDPDLGALLRKSWVQGRLCTWRNEPALCLAIGWRDPKTIDQWQQHLLAKVPLPLGPSDKVHAKKKYDDLLTWAMRHQRRPIAGGECSIEQGCPDKSCADGQCFMVGLHSDGSLEHGDLAIFSGIACASGVDEGCRLTKTVQSADGRFWRSPWRIGEPDTTDHASFSGDQLKGVLHYFSRGTLSGDDKNRLRAFLKYLKSQPTEVPLQGTALERGYSSCTQRAPNFTCLIGPDWTLLNYLAQANGVADELPSDITSIISRYGISLDTLVWESLVTNTGYRLHLVANTAWLLKKTAPPDPRVDLAIKIIAARQPENPFFLWLLLGSDKKVQAQLDAKCPVPPTNTSRIDWAWQRAELEKRWERSMVWDCVAMYHSALVN